MKKTKLFLGALTLSFAIISCGGKKEATADSEQTEKTEAVAQVAALGECPAASEIALTWNDEAIKASPDEWALKLGDVKTTMCSFNKDSKTINIFFPVGDLKTKDMADPLEMKQITAGQGFVKITFKLANGNMPSVGEYKAEYKAAEEVYMGIKCMKGNEPWYFSYGDATGGARIIDIKDGKICGDFNFKSVNGPAEYVFKGTFNAKIEEFENF